MRLRECACVSLHTERAGYIVIDIGATHFLRTSHQVEVRVRILQVFLIIVQIGRRVGVYIWYTLSALEYTKNMKRLRRTDCTWSPKLAYFIGLIASDGNLSPDGRHISITSKDKQLILLVRKILGSTNKIGRKGRGGSIEKKYYVYQFGDIHFYEFLLTIGLTPAKSKTIGEIGIPAQYFSHFLRGCIDGDGSITGFHHPESTNFQLRVSLCSASPDFLQWIHSKIAKFYGIKGGWISANDRRGAKSLVFGIKDSMRLLREIYASKGELFLKRKYRIAEGYLEE